MPAIREHHLPNGMTLMCLHQSHLHAVEFGLYFKGGPLYENEQTQGICHLLEHLCFRSLGGLSHDELQRTLSRMGAQLDGSTYKEAVVFHVGALPRFFDDLLGLSLRFFADLPWTQEQIDQEKQVVLRQIEQDEPDFDEMVYRRFRETTEGVYPAMGTSQSLQALDAGLIRQWQRRLFQPRNACLCITGNFSDGMEQAAVEALSELVNPPVESCFEQAVPFDFCMRDEHSDYVTDEEGGQAKVRLAFDMNAEQVYPLVGDILCAITGGNDDSLLFQELREEEALVAEIDAVVDGLGPFRRLLIEYDVRQEYLVESLRKVFALLQRLRTYIRPVRLELLRMQFTDNRFITLDSACDMNELMGWAWLTDDMGQADLDAQAAMFDNLTAEELLDAAQAVFRPENLVISIQRDAELTPADLTPLLKELRRMLC